MARRAAIGVGPEIPRAFYVLFARVLNSGKNIAFRNRDEWIAFVVFEVGVEKRRELVDEVLFEHERLVFVAHHHVLKRRNLLKHHGDFRTLVLPHDVLLHAGTKLLRFSDVDYLSRRVLPQIDARKRRYAFQLLFQASDLFIERFVLGWRIEHHAAGSAQRAFVFGC